MLKLKLDPLKMPTKLQKKQTREPQELRRAALINATIEVIAQDGLSKVTSQKVAAVAGVTAAMVNFHFKGKDALLHATLTSVTEEFKETIQNIVDENLPPRDMLLALIHISLSKKLADYKKSAVWYAFYGESRTRNLYTEICLTCESNHYQAFEDPIKYLCDESSHSMDAKALAIGLIGVIEYFVQTILVEPDFDREAGKETCLNYLKSIFPYW